MKLFIRSRCMVCLLLTIVCVVSVLPVSASAQEPVPIEELSIFLSQTPAPGKAVEDCVVFSSASGCGLTEYTWLDSDGQSVSGSFKGASTQLQLSFEALNGYRFSPAAKVTLDGEACDCRVSEDGTSLSASARFYFSDAGKTSKHEHSYGGWEYDNRTHWQRCVECGQMSAVSVHTMVWESSTGANDLQKGICSVCGYSVYRGNEGTLNLVKNHSGIGLYIFLFVLALLVVLVVVFNLFSKLKHAIQRKKKEKARRSHHTHHHHHHHHSDKPGDTSGEEGTSDFLVDIPAETKENDGAYS